MHGLPGRGPLGSRYRQDRAATELSKDKTEDKQNYLTAYASVLESYQDARTSKHYAVKWPGELAFRIGFVHYSSSLLLKDLDRKLGKTEADLAHRELAAASLKSITESTKGIPGTEGASRGARRGGTRSRSASLELENEYQIVPKQSSRAEFPGDFEFHHSIAREEERNRRAT